MEGLEVTVLLGLAVLVGTVLAPRMRVATPLVLLVIGLALGLVPALREVQLPPETVLLLFLPVMLFWESLTTSLRSIRRDFRYILPMSTLLVVASAFAVAGVACLFGLPWEAALILGAAVAPPDATAVAALGRTLPPRMFMKLKAESLTNDGTALVLYAIAVSLAVGEHVSPLSVSWLVVVSYAGGILIGVAIAALAYVVLRRLRSALEINLALLVVPFAAFLLAELIEASGVLAVVVAGLIVAWVLPRLTTAASRQQAQVVYPMGTYVLNGALFVLIGLEVQHVAFESSWSQMGRLLLVTVAVWIALIVVRYLFQLASAPFSRPRPGQAHVPARLRNRARLVSTFAGFRGAVSLAIALSVPLMTESGAPLEGRDEVIFVTAGVIVLSLLVQGPLLPFVVRWANLPADTTAEQEFEMAQRTITGAALAAVDDLAKEHGISDEIRDRVRQQGYEMLELANARTLARAQAIVPEDVELEELEELVGQTPPARSGPRGPSLSLPDGGALEMMAVSTDLDELQLSPLVRHEQLKTLNLALLDRQKEVLTRLRREGAIDNVVAYRLQSAMDQHEVKLRGTETIE